MNTIRRWIRARQARNPRRSSDYRSWSRNGGTFALTGAGVSSGPIRFDAAAVRVVEGFEIMEKARADRALFARRPVLVDWQSREWA